MSDKVDDLRATSDSIGADATRLNALEAEKRALEPADPRVVELSRDIEAIAAALATKAGVERVISEEIQRDEAG